MFEHTVRIYWEDTDAGGIVFYANYLKFFERARTEWLRSMGIAQQRLREEVGGMFVVTHTETRYHRPARLDDVLVVTVQPLLLGKATCTLQQHAYLGNTGGALLCECRSRIGWVDSSSMQAARIPPAVAARFANADTHHA